MNFKKGPAKGEVMIWWLKNVYEYWVLALKSFQIDKSS